MYDDGMAPREPLVVAERDEAKRDEKYGEETRRKTGGTRPCPVRLP